MIYINYKTYYKFAHFLPPRLFWGPDDLHGPPELSGLLSDLGAPWPDPLLKPPELPDEVAGLDGAAVVVLHWLSEVLSFLSSTLVVVADYAVEVAD